jgi:hypothetical protein
MSKIVNPLTGRLITVNGALYKNLVNDGIIKINIVKSPVKKNNNLTDQESRYCSCVLKVGSKNKNVNPYAICTKSVGINSRNCGKNYDYGNMEDTYLLTYARLSKIKIPRPYNREKLINNIYDWKKSH